MYACAQGGDQPTGRLRRAHESVALAKLLANSSCTTAPYRSPLRSWGFNYARDGAMRLHEDYWNADGPDGWALPEPPDIGEILLQEQLNLFQRLAPGP